MIWNIAKLSFRAAVSEQVIPPLTNAFKGKNELKRKKEGRKEGREEERRFFFTSGMAYNSSMDTVPDLFRSSCWNR